MTASGRPRAVRARHCLGLLLGVAVPLLLRAADTPVKAVEPADEDLIEFLGSVDSDDKGWKEYLARKSARKPAVTKSPPVPPTSSAPGTDGAQDEH